MPTELPFCTDCGTRNETDAVFCEQCGRGLADAGAETAPSSRTAFSSEPRWWSWWPVMLVGVLVVGAAYALRGPLSSLLASLTGSRSPPAQSVPTVDSQLVTLDSSTGTPPARGSARPLPPPARRSARPLPPPLCEPEECATLGERYETGSGVAQDVTRAIEYYRAGCKAQVVKSCGHLGSILMLRGTTEEEYTEAIAPLRLACDSGYPIACSNLGAAYGLGRGGLPKDDRHAHALFVKACDMDNAIACTIAGIHLFGGPGIPRDVDRAFEYLRKGCRLGDDKACQDLKSQ